MGLGSEPAAWALHLQAQEGGQSKWRQQNVLELVRARLDPERPLALHSLDFLTCKLEGTPGSGLAPGEPRHRMGLGCPRMGTKTLILARSFIHSSLWVK